MIRSHIIFIRDVLDNTRAPHEGADYIRWRVNAEPIEVTKDDRLRAFIITTDSPDVIDSTARVISQTPGKLPIQRRRRHPKEGGWPDDVEFKETP